MEIILSSFRLTAIVFLLQLSIISSCSSCLVSTVVKAGSTSLALKGGKVGTTAHHHHHHHHHHHFHHQSNHLMALGMNHISKKFGMGRKLLETSYFRHFSRNGVNSVLTYIVLRQLSTHYGCQNTIISPHSGDATTGTSSLYNYYHQGMFFSSNDMESKEGTTNEGNDDLKTTPNEDTGEEKVQSSSTNNVSVGMVGAIGIYKNFISPLLPPACRFLPTCSQYGVQAIEEFGPTKGAVLTAWRLLRCSPFGGRGYDPPKWPPVPYTYGSY